MSYMSIHQCAQDQEFQARIMAAAAQEGSDNPEHDAMTVLRWPVAASSDVEDAYEFAVNSGNEHPGSDPTVITDAMILAKVQAVLNPPEDPEA